MVDIIKSFVKPYEQTGKHRKKCRHCWKLIQDGELTRFLQIETEEYYPVKNKMSFINWIPMHEDCYDYRMDQFGRI